MFFTSCDEVKVIDNEETNTNSNLVEITKTQFDANDMALGKLEEKSFSESIKCNGNIMARPSGIAKISPSVSGFVKSINVCFGQRIEANQVLFELSGNEFIEIQQDFAETASQLNNAKSEYDRINELFNEKIGTEKELISAKSKYKTLNAKYISLKMKLEIIGISPAKVENGDFYDSFVIKSPISGSISEINVSLGQNASTNDVLAQVIDNSMFYLKISIFERDINKLKIGQEVKFNLSGSNEDMTAVLSSIGKVVNYESKTIDCYASINDLKAANFVNNAFAQVEIMGKENNKKAISEDAIIKADGKFYLLVLKNKTNENFIFEKTEVEIGQTINGYTEILNKESFNDILTKGAYYINVE